MIILLLTIFVSLALAVFFVALFVLQRRDDFSSSPEHDALLPLREEQPAVQLPADDDNAAEAAP